MDCLIFLVSRSRFPFPLIEGAGIAGIPGIPVSGHFGNRGKETVSLGITGFDACIWISKSREVVKPFPEIFPVLCFFHNRAIREKNRPHSGTKREKP